MTLMTPADGPPERSALASKGPPMLSTAPLIGPREREHSALSSGSPQMSRITPVTDPRARLSEGGRG